MKTLQPVLLKLGLVLAVGLGAYAMGAGLLWPSVLEPHAIYPEPTLAYAGERIEERVDLVIRFLDGRPGGPVADVSVQLWRGKPVFDYPVENELEICHARDGDLLSEATSGPDGVAVISFKGHGYTQSDHNVRRDWLEFRGYTLVVVADGFGRQEHPLEAIIGKRSVLPPSGVFYATVSLDIPMG